MSTEEDKYIENLRTILDPKNVGQISPEHLSAVLDTVTKLAIGYRERAEKAEKKIEEANQIMSETSSSWGHKIHNVLAALGLDYGDADHIDKLIAKEVPDDIVWKRLSEEREERFKSDQQMHYRSRGRRYLWCNHVRDMANIIHHFNISDEESENLLNLLGTLSDMGLWHNDKARPTLRLFSCRLDKEAKARNIAKEEPDTFKSVR
jgi:hypothetical protein